MKHLKRIAAAAMVVVMLAASFVFADSMSIVSPSASSILYTDNLLVSVKVTEPKTIRVTVYEKKLKSGDNYVSADVGGITTDNLSEKIADSNLTDVVISEAEEYTNTGEIGFYTKQLSVKPGIFKVKAEVLETVMEWPEGGGEPKETVIVKETATSTVVIKEKPQETKKATLTTNSSGALTFIQRILKTIFK